ncbi:MAG: hypothetical protein SFW35_12690 [Chitinophagales bacterium]|nr:hypothetical protein [Chitinophagales bacterium]
MLYPAKRGKGKKVTFQKGSYATVGGKGGKDCSLLLVDILDESGLNKDIGKFILEEIGKE